MSGLRCVSWVMVGALVTAGPLPTAAGVQASPEYDISRIAQVQSAFPDDFVAGQSPRRSLDPMASNAVGNVVGQGFWFAANPVECADEFKLVNTAEGVQTVSVDAHPAANVQDGRRISVAAYTPLKSRAGIDSRKCDHISYEVPLDEDTYSGTVERIVAPDVQGADTAVFKDQVDGKATVDYYYAAVLGDQVFVAVQASLEPDFAAQPLLSDLLVKSVAAVRGR